MNFNGWSSFEDFAKACGYTTSNNNSTNNDNNLGCEDIPNGFQSLHPELFIIIGEILGAIMAGTMPFNVQNAIGNWFELLGQVILTYNAQQQYFQSGPGRYFNPQNYNISNPFCQNNTSNTSNTTTATSSKIEELEKEIKKLYQEILEIKKILNK